MFTSNARNHSKEFKPPPYVNGKNLLNLRNVSNTGMLFTIFIRQNAKSKDCT